MLALDLLLAPERCSRCDCLLGKELCGRDESGSTICLVCSRNMLSSVSWETFVPVELHAEPAVAVPVVRAHCEFGPVLVDGAE